MSDNNTNHVQAPSGTGSKNRKGKSFAVDFDSLTLASLKRYRRQYRIRVKPTLSKPELVSAVREHFATIPAPDEDETISQFLRALRKAGDTDGEAAGANDKDLLTGTAVIAVAKQRRRRPKQAARESPKKAPILDSDIPPPQSNTIQANSQGSRKRRRAPQTPSTAKLQPSQGSTLTPSFL